jgi:hypothetical protein
MDHPEWYVSSIRIRRARGNGKVYRIRSDPGARRGADGHDVGGWDGHDVGGWTSQITVEYERATATGVQVPRPVRLERE